jgi:hypothetical protein
MALVAENERKRLMEQINKDLKDHKPGDTDKATDEKFAEVRKDPAMKKVWEADQDDEQ